MISPKLIFILAAFRLYLNTFCIAHCLSLSFEHFLSRKVHIVNVMVSITWKIIGNISCVAQVTAYEQQIGQMTTSHEKEMAVARSHHMEAEAAILSLKEERLNLQKKVENLDGSVQHLRDELQTERSLAASRDHSSRTSIEDRDSTIVRLKAQLSDNQSTALELREQLSKINDEVAEKNGTIRQLRRSCDELGARCGELESALCRTSLDSSRLSYGHPFPGNVSVQQLCGKSRRSVGSEASVELTRHEQDNCGDVAELERQRHLSAAQVSSSLAADTSACVSEVLSNQLDLSGLAAGGSHMSSQSVGTVATDGEGFGRTVTSDMSPAEALSVARQQLLRRVFAIYT